MTNKTMTIVMSVAAVYFTAISIIIMSSGNTLLALADFVAAVVLFISAVNYKRAWDEEKKHK